jgi:hypothetical protein
MLIVGGTVMTNLAFCIISKLSHVSHGSLTLLQAALYATYVDGAATASNLKAGQSALIFSFCESLLRVCRVADKLALVFFVIMYEIGEPAMCESKLAGLG